MSKDTSGPAFQPGYCPPFAVFPAGSQQPDTNMSLRDWFAGQALMGSVASPEFMKIITAADIPGNTAFDRLAGKMYGLADSMLKARGEP